DHASLRVCRLVERAVVPGKVRRAVTLVTDLVTLPRAPAGDRLLVYSTQNGARAPLRLVTAFPVTPAVARDLQSATRPRQKVEIRPKYNAYLPGFRGRTIFGRRVLVPTP